MENVSANSASPTGDELTLNQWADAVHTLSKEKGWHEDRTSKDREKLACFLMNLHTEISELWEAYREGRLRAPCDKAEKMKELGFEPLTCLEEELADIVIRSFDMAEAIGVDMEKAISTKHAYNATRAYRHGGKLA